MKPIVTLLAALAMAGAAALPAAAQILANPITPGFKITKVQLAIQPPPDNVCPGTATMTVWVFTNQPGSASFMVVRQGAGVAGPYQVDTVAGSGGVNLGTWTQQLNIVSPIDAAYRVVVPNSTVASNWVPLAADC